MKALKSKSLMSLIYAVLLALPFCAILSRVIYVQSNKNAYQSYSGRNTVNETIEPVQNNTTLDINTIYHLSLTRDTEFANTASTAVWDVSLVDYSTDDTATTTFLENYNQFAIQFSANASYFIMRGEDNTLKYWYYNTNNYLNMSFTLNIETNSLNLSKFLSVRSTTNNYFMDNVFEYSVSQFVSENDFGQMNLFSWFDDLFLSNSNHNHLYVHFANWYLNYAMLVSLMQILFLVLMWFVNFSRKLLDRGMNYDW